MPTIIIDDRKVQAAAGETVLTAARRAGIDIPTLCHHEAVEPSGACRLCMVEVTMPAWDGWQKLVTACLYPVAEGLRVQTMSDRVKQTRALVLDLLLARSPDARLVQDLARDYGVHATSFQTRDDPDDCILCGLCVRVCAKVGAHAITTANRGFQKVIAGPFGEPPVDCIGCGACAEVCPTDFIQLAEAEGRRRIWDRDFAMARCESCGEPFMTEAERDHLVRSRGLDASYYLECSACKRQRTGATFAEVVLKTHPGFEPKQMGGTPAAPTRLPDRRKKEVVR